MEIDSVAVPPSKAKAQEAMVGTHIEKRSAFGEKLVGYGEKILLEALIDDDQAQKRVAHFRVAERVVTNTNQLKRGLAGQLHPCRHETVPAQKPGKFLDDRGGGGKHSSSAAPQTDTP